MTELLFHYDFASPNVYLVLPRLRALAKQYDAQLVMSPALIGGIFKATNNQPPLMAFSGIGGKNAYIELEFQRFLERFKVPFTWNPHFPVNSLTLMRGAVFAHGKDWEDAYVDCCMAGMWQKALNLSDAEVIRECLEAGDLPADDILAATQDPEIKAELATRTQNAVDQGIFGLPAVFLGKELFFGKDSLWDLEWRLQGGT